MQPFPVLCETCGVKLKVRDPAAIGQIHACPNCDSMVLIAAPATATAETTRPPTPEVPVATTDGPQMLAPVDFAAEIDHLLQSPADVDTSLASQPVADESISRQDESLSATPMVESLAEVPLDAPPGGRTGWLVWGTAGCVACFSLGLTAAAWWTQADGQGDRIVAAADLDGEPAEQDIPSKPTAALEVPTPPTVVAANKPVVERAAEVVAELADPAEHGNQLEPTDANVARVAALPDLPPATQDVEPPPRDGPQSNRDPLPPLDPLAIDTANLDLLLIPDSAPAAAPAAEVDGNPSPSLPAPNPIQVAAPRRELRFQPGSSSRGPTFAEGFAEGELTSRLEMQLPDVAWRKTPFHQALFELSQLSGVPISIDPAVLRMAGVRADRPISLDEQNATVMQLATAMAGTVRLEAVRDAVGLSLTKARADDSRQVQYRVNDLVAGANDASAIAALVRQFVLPDSWEDGKARMSVDGNTLSIQQRTAAHYEILIFCERLRKARGLAPRSKYPAALLDVEPRLLALQRRLSRRTTFAFVDWIPLAEVFDYWQQTSGLVLLVDWQRLADQDLRPRSTMAGSVNNAAWADSLDACLTPLDLAWIPVDAGTVQITTRDVADQTSWVEFYPGTDIAELRQRVDNRCEASDLATFAATADAASDLMIVRGNRAIHSATQP